MNYRRLVANVFGLCIALAYAGTLVSCKTIPSNVYPVQEFNSERYLGEWYEIARFDFRFEKNMMNVRANYTMNKDGTIRVVNSGFDYMVGKDKMSIGKAKFVARNDIGALKVSFFGPFYSGYNVIAIDPDYQYALVAGGNKKLLWILSRYPTIPERVKENYLEIAKSAGYDLTNLVWTVQE